MSKQPSWPPPGVDWYYSDDWVAIAHVDCREIMLGIESDVLVTDPPYGHGGTPPRGGRKPGTLTKVATHLSWDTVDDSWIALWPDKPVAVFMSAARCFIMAQLLRADGLLIYVKSNPHPNGSSFEPCVTRGFGIGARHTFAYNAENGQQHPTQKPLSVMRFVVERAPSGTILDPFMGSGTTLRAVKDLNRRAIGIEIEEKYCEIAARRMSQEVFDFSGASK